MSQVVAISLELDAGQSVKEVESLENAIKKVKTTTDLSTVEQNFNELNQAIDSGGNSVENLQRAVKSYQTIALTAGRESPIGKQAIARASALQDELADLNNEIKRNAHDGRAMQGALEIGSSVTAGYQAFAGVSALVGEENEELLETLTKLQATQGVMQGLEQIRVSLEKESVAVLALKNAQQKIQNGLMIAYNVIVGTGTKAMKLFRLALIATGIGALVALIGTLIANWDSWGDSIMNFINNALSPFKKALQFLGLVESDNEAIRREAHEQRIADTEEQIKMLQEQEDVIKDKFDHEIALLRASGKETAEVERAKLLAVRDRAVRELKLLIELYERKKELTKEEVERGYELNAIIKKQSNELEIFDAQQKKKQEDRDKASYKKRKQIRDKASQDELKDLERQEQLKLDLQNKFEDLVIANIEDDSQRKLMAQELAFKREREQIIAQFGENERLINELEENQRIKRDALKEELRVADVEQEKLATLDRVENLNFYQNAFAESMMQLTENTKARDEAIRQSKQNLIQATSSSLGQLSSVIGQTTKAGKALALTQIAIDTAVGFANGLRIAQQGAIATGPGAPFAFPIFYATQIGAVLSAVGKAKSILKAGSGVSAPSVPSASSGTTRTENRTTRNNADGNNNDAGRTDFYNNRAIVVESDVNNVRNRLNQINVISSI